ncbi:prephenate dehydrogenase [Paenibacillus sp. UNCCL117]|uniref:prephenate dehydrogenase n=1 Tax=unclassified Paenibacillus TaxID=185978 RepID=UPI000881A834|nr:MULTISPECIES: prephenate dehydrogenase [unclassified Paenibacillus]SDC40919.1 prephenate dehydrogenase [Paenibacillus sp. cl123]SFW13662.1 prephenate dehydrogenase [Paenibacillus sp. UNCCL117]
MTKIAIFGVGLIGGSLALSFKGKPGLHIVGHSNNPASVEKYMKREVVDYATTSLEEAAADADFIFLCVPVGNLEQYLHKLAELKLKPGCVITDVGSTKAAVASGAAALDFGGAYFIGGHPMAGKEKSGVEAASSRLFENAFYVLTPAADTPPDAYDRLAKLLEHTRAHLVKVEPVLHDEIVGAISHLPHIIAVALVNQIARYNESNELYQILAAGGFRDITRIASSDPIIWRDILLTNKEAVLRLLKDWNAEIAGFVKLIEDEDGSGIEREFQQAGTFRSSLPERRKGVMQSFYDIYVDVPDHPGVIGQITMLLGSHRVNLSNIQVIESRENVPGVLRLSFREEGDMDKAIELLKKDYAVYV